MVALMQSIRNNESAEGTGSDTKIQIFFLPNIQHSSCPDSYRMQSVRDYQDGFISVMVKNIIERCLLLAWSFIYLLILCHQCMAI